jgi:hypothetical protein
VGIVSPHPPYCCLVGSIPPHPPLNILRTLRLHVFLFLQYLFLEHRYLVLLLLFLLLMRIIKYINIILSDNNIPKKIQNYGKITLRLLYNIIMYRNYNRTILLLTLCFLVKRKNNTK